MYTQSACTRLPLLTKPTQGLTKSLPGKISPFNLDGSIKKYNTIGLGSVLVPLLREGYLSSWCSWIICRYSNIIIFRIVYLQCHNLDRDPFLCVKHEVCNCNLSYTHAERSLKQCIMWVRTAIIISIDFMPRTVIHMLWNIAIFVKPVVNSPKHQNHGLKMIMYSSRKLDHEKSTGIVPLWLHPCSWFFLVIVWWNDRPLVEEGPSISGVWGHRTKKLALIPTV